MEGSLKESGKAQENGKWDHVNHRWTAHPVSLIECILSCELPISTVLIPIAALSIGPMVLPHVESFLTTNSWSGTFAPRATSWQRTIPGEFVA